MNDDYKEKDNLNENGENTNGNTGFSNEESTDLNIPLSNEEESIADKGINSEISTDEKANTAEFVLQQSNNEKPDNQNTVYYGDLGYTTKDPSYLRPKKKKNNVLIAVLCSVFGVIILMSVLVVTAMYSLGYIKNNISLKNNSAANSEYNLPIASNPGTDTSKLNANGELSIPQISEKLKNSVVSIIVRSGNLSEGLGSGIIMKEDGYIVTNSHVIEGSTSIEVITSDSKSYSAQLIGKDSKTDLAVIKINATGLLPAEFGDSDKLVVGETVVAIGNPYGLEFSNTVTRGIISAIRKNIMMESRKMDLLQTDAQINPGNSGGPLVNSYGQVIGINSMKIMSAGGTFSEGLGFAIPVNTAKPIIEQLINTGYIPNRPMIGISGYFIDKVDNVPFDHPAGIFVDSVDPKSDAASKGIERYDIITKINGKDIISMNEFLTEKENFKVNETITLTVWHLGKTSDVKITLVESKS